LLIVWRRDDAHFLIVPAAIFTSTTCVAVIAYVTQPNWLWEVLTADDLGYVYGLLVFVSAGLLVDIACNRARVSSVLARAFWFWPA
jgi:hypothetical protein